MKCPYCGLDNNFVVGHDGKSRFSKLKEGYRRYRKCGSCSRNFITIEKYEPEPRERNKEKEVKPPKEPEKPKAFIKIRGGVIK